jgi:anaerobic ribonucleoside-triphosphate reductase activating protein
VDLRVHAVLPRSYANGPGARFVIWTQGCTLACPGCFNPETHSGDGGERRTTEELAEAAINAEGIDGVTITGGEPLQQSEAVAEFCGQVKGHRSIVILTGFSRREIESDPVRMKAVENADMVVAGRYNAGRYLGKGLRGSGNKEYWALTGRYGPEDFTAIPDVEVILTVTGERIITGMPA